MTPHQKRRLTHINHLMNGVHDSSNEIYEHLVDREIKQTKLAVKALIKKLEAILNSLQDES
tara:strand:+ start:143 stop:325 length:183 start_codon:yes stop_codon:yes gene_type:complete